MSLFAEIVFLGHEVVFHPADLIHQGLLLYVDILSLFGQLHELLLAIVLQGPQIISIGCFDGSLDFFLLDLGLKITFFSVSEVS